MSNNVIDFSLFKIPRETALSTRKVTTTPMNQPTLTSHEANCGAFDFTQEPQESLGPFEIAVDNLMTHWYNGDVNKAKIQLFDIYALVNSTAATTKGK